MVAEADGVDVPRVTFTNHAGETLTVSAGVGDSVMETAKRQHVPGIRGDCGGFMMCATCHVYVTDDLAALPPVSAEEDEMLDGTVCERAANSRLSCQLKIQPDSDIHVTLPERQL